MAFRLFFKVELCIHGPSFGSHCCRGAGGVGYWQRCFFRGVHIGVLCSASCYCPSHNPVSYTQQVEFRRNSSLQAAWDTSIARTTSFMLRHLIISRICTLIPGSVFAASPLRQYAIFTEIYPILFVHPSSAVMEQKVFPFSRLVLLAIGKCH